MSIDSPPPDRLWPQRRHYSPIWIAFIGYWHLIWIQLFCHLHFIYRKPFRIHAACRPVVIMWGWVEADRWAVIGLKRRRPEPFDSELKWLITAYNCPCTDCRSRGLVDPPGMHTDKVSSLSCVWGALSVRRSMMFLQHMGTEWRFHHLNRHEYGFYKIFRFDLIDSGKM